MSLPESEKLETNRKIHGNNSKLNRKNLGSIVFHAHAMDFVSIIMLRRFCAAGERHEKPQTTSIINTNLSPLCSRLFARYFTKMTRKKQQFGVQSHQMTITIMILQLCNKVYIHISMCMNMNREAWALLLKQLHAPNQMPNLFIILFASI